MGVRDGGSERGESKRSNGDGDGWEEEEGEGVEMWMLWVEVGKGKVAAWTRAANEILYLIV